jgi:hypothetical protein
LNRRLETAEVLRVYGFVLTAAPSSALPSTSDKREQYLLQTSVQSRDPCRIEVKRTTHSLTSISSITTKEISKLLYYKLWLLFWNPVSRQKNNCAIDVFSQSRYTVKYGIAWYISSKCWIKLFK